MLNYIYICVYIYMPIWELRAYELSANWDDAVGAVISWCLNTRNPAEVCIQP